MPAIWYVFKYKLHIKRKTFRKSVWHQITKPFLQQQGCRKTGLSKNGMPNYCLRKKKINAINIKIFYIPLLWISFPETYASVTYLQRITYIWQENGNYVRDHHYLQQWFLLKVMYWPINICVTHSILKKNQVRNCVT